MHFASESKNKKTFRENVPYLQVQETQLYKYFFPFAVRAAEEAAAGRAGAPRGEEEAAALGRTPEQRPRERERKRTGKRKRPVLRASPLY